MIADLIPNVEYPYMDADGCDDREVVDGLYCLTCQGFVNSEMHGNTCTCDIHGLEVSK